MFRAMQRMRSILLKLATIGCGLLAGLVIAECACNLCDIRNTTKRLGVIRTISRVSDIPGVRYELIHATVQGNGPRQQPRVSRT